ncbi:MAG: cytochrome C-552 [Inquilinus sp.]|nr:cytochrome C-552 [Inquilinus sp.]
MLLLAGGAATAQQSPGSLGPGYDPLAPSHAPAPSAPAIETSDEYGGLPVGEGVDLTYYMCGACHSIRLVTQQRVTRARWDYLLDWMVEKQGMAPLPPEDRAVVLDYLSRHFSSGS